MKSSPRTSFAVSVAALFVAACSKGAEVASAVPDDSSPKVKCLGVHECKGQSACGVPGGHACAGQNECKGKGWIETTGAECDAKGGKIL